MTDVWKSISGGIWKNTRADAWYGLDSGAPDIPPWAIVRYLFVLTGYRDGLEDIQIPIGSFQSRVNSTDPSYLSVVIPNADAWIGAISARGNSQLVVYGAYIVGSTELLRRELCRADLETINVDKGSLNQSITLLGHKSRVYMPVEVMTLEGIQYYASSGGLRRFRAKPNFSLRPNSVIEYESEYITVGSISWTVSVDQQTMEISEVEDQETVNTIYALKVNTNIGIVP